MQNFKDVQFSSLTFCLSVIKVIKIHNWPKYKIFGSIKQFLDKTYLVP